MIDLRLPTGMDGLPYHLKLTTALKYGWSRRTHVNYILLNSKLLTLKVVLGPDPPSRFQCAERPHAAHTRERREQAAQVPQLKAWKPSWMWHVRSAVQPDELRLRQRPVKVLVMVVMRSADSVRTAVHDKHK